MIASGLIELGFTVAGPDTGDDYDARVVDAGDGSGPHIAEWRSKKKQPAMAEIIAAGEAREARLAAAKPLRQQVEEMAAEISTLKARLEVEQP